MGPEAERLSIPVLRRTPAIAPAYFKRPSNFDGGDGPPQQAGPTRGAACFAERRFENLLRRTSTVGQPHPFRHILLTLLAYYRSFVRNPAGTHAGIHYGLNAAKHQQKLTVGEMRSPVSALA